MTWTCPRCDRRFGAVHRPHVCAPAMPLALWLDELPDGQRRAAEKVLAIFAKEDLVIEAVSVGVLVKRERTVVELRSKKKWLDVSFLSAAPIASPKIARSLSYQGGHVYYVHLADARDVDAEVRRWLKTAVARRRS